MSYSFYIDESGDAGIKIIRDENTNGASQYMTLGGVLIPDENKDQLVKEIIEFKKIIAPQRSYLHCCELSHEQKVRFCQFLNSKEVMCFGIISYKETLGSYKHDISSQSTRYYNKCAQYLLEKLSLYLSQTKIDGKKVKIFFEDGNISHTKLKSLISLCQQNPIRPESRILNQINTQNIFSSKKLDEDLFQLSDLIAHSLYKCVDGGKYDVLETRYLNEIKDKFFEKEKRALGHGIFAIHNLEDIKVTDGVKNFFSTL